MFYIWKKCYREATRGFLKTETKVEYITNA